MHWLVECIDVFTNSSFPMKYMNFSFTGIPEDKWIGTCVLIDKLEKISMDALVEDMTALGLKSSTVQILLGFLKV